MQLAVFDPKITEDSPAGSCVLKMLLAASEFYRLEIFTTQTSLQSASGITIHRIPVPRKPVFLESIVFSLCSILFHTLYHSKNLLTIATQGVFPVCDVSYAHCCHKLFLTRYRAHITGGFFVRGARLLNHAWSAATEGAAFKRARLIVVPSLGLSDELISMYGSELAPKLRIIPNPVDFKLFASQGSKPPDGPFTFAFCALGNFEWKGLAIVIQALATGIRARLQVIGGSPGEINSFQSLALRAGVADRIAFAGMQLDIRPYLWSSHAFVLPSVYESFSLVCLQAAAAGLPLIAPALHGLDRLLQPGVSGWRVERSVESVAAAMQEALADPQHTREMGLHAQRSAEQYDDPAFQQRWLDLLLEAGRSR